MYVSWFRLLVSTGGSFLRANYAEHCIRRSHVVMKLCQTRQGASCKDSKPDIDASAYVAVFVDTSAELPVHLSSLVAGTCMSLVSRGQGLLMAALLVEHAGRVGTLTFSMVLCGVCCLLMMLPLEDLATT
eukprot:gene9492-11245_t